MWIYITTIVAFLQVAVCTIQVNPCTNLPDAPMPLHFVSEGCDKLPCPLYRGTSANVNITYNIPYDMDTGTFDIWAHTFGTWIEFKPPDNQMCHSLTNTYCPLDKGERVTYHLLLLIIKAYPPVSLNLRFTFRDEQMNPIMCFEIPCKVANLPKPTLQ